MSPMNQTQNFKGYILAWGLWALTSAFGAFIAFWAVLDAIGSLTEALTMKALQYGTTAERFQVAYTRNAVQRFGVLGLGILSVLFLVLVEHYYRAGVDQGRLWKRFLQLTTIEFGVLFVALTIQAISTGVLGLFTIWSVLFPVAVLALTLVLGWVLKRMPKRPSPA